MLRCPLVPICVWHEIILPHTFCFALPCCCRVLGYTGCKHTTYFSLEVENKSENLTNETKHCQWCEVRSAWYDSILKVFFSFFCSSLHNTSCLVYRWHPASSGLPFVLVMFFFVSSWVSILVPEVKVLRMTFSTRCISFVFLYVCEVWTQLRSICLEFSLITVLSDGGNVACEKEVGCGMIVEYITSWHCHSHVVFKDWFPFSRCFMGFRGSYKVSCADRWGSKVEDLWWQRWRSSGAS